MQFNLYIFDMYKIQVLNGFTLYLLKKMITRFSYLIAQFKYYQLNIKF